MAEAEISFNTAERRLSNLMKFLNILFSSRETSGVYWNAVSLVMEMLPSDTILLFVVDEAENELKPAAYAGISEPDVVSLLKSLHSDGIYYDVFRTGKPAAGTDDSEWARRCGIKSQSTVPLMINGRVNGVLSAARRQAGGFNEIETGLLSLVGTQIAVAIENARLSGEQENIAGLLAESEGNYRRLFERASDAIWANDLNGLVTVANRASAELMGDSLEDMVGTDVRKYLSPEGLATARRVRQALLSGEPLQQPYEQHLIRKDKSEVILMVSSSLVRHGDEPPVFEHIARDVTRERRMQDNLRHYVQQITRTQEEERNRIARDLHDDTVQALYAMTRQVDNYIRRSEILSEGMVTFLRNLEEQLRGVSQGVRRFSQDLRPPMLDDLGLLSTLRWLTGDIEQRCGICTSLVVSGTERRLQQHIELAIFRIIQEALRNVEKHAEATVVGVTVDFDPRQIVIKVEDNGIGFELSELGDLPQVGRLGLMGMEERARLLGGSIEIQSELKVGTSVVIIVPV